MLRFHLPLGEPDVRFSRIRLSMKSSRSDPRETPFTTLETFQAQHLVEVAVREPPVNAASHLVFSAQPMTQTALDVAVNGAVDTTDRPQTEVGGRSV